MPKSTDFSPAADGTHSFLYWLAIPLILLWLAGGYLIGATGDRPAWYNPVSPSQISPYLSSIPALPQTDTGYITIWFDDAWLSQYLVAFPLFQKYGFPGVIAVPINAVEQKDYMNWAQLQIMQTSGWEITNHSTIHDCEMHTWPVDKVRREYRASKLALWKHRLSSDILVTPCGVDSGIMRDEAAKAFLAYRTVNPGDNRISTLDLNNLRVRNIDNQTTPEQIKSWIDNAKNPDQWEILVLHQLGENTNPANTDIYNLDPKVLNEILEYIKQTQIPVVTPSQIISFVIQ
jgi:hypothetical protein